MVDVDDNDDHTVTDDERIRLVSGLKMRPDSTAFARARGARDEGIREQYPSGDTPSRVFVLDRLKDDDDDDDDDDDETDVESIICVDA